MYTSIVILGVPKSNGELSSLTSACDEHGNSIPVAEGIVLSSRPGGARKTAV